MGFLPRIALVLGPLLLAGCAATGVGAANGIEPFSTDGCSLFPDRSLINNSDWCRCCLIHDLAYWRGGTAEERLLADQELRACVQQATENQGLATLMYGGVRAGGGPDFYTSYRWAYGWPYGRGYTPLSAAEKLLASEQEQKYRALNPTLVCPNPKATPAKPPSTGDTSPGG